MTNKEALIATLQVSVPDTSVDLQLINSEIDGAATYSVAMRELIEKACIPLLYGLFTAPDINEGGYAINHPDFLRKVKERLLYFAKKYEVEELIEELSPKSIVNGASPW